MIKFLVYVISRYIITFKTLTSYIDYYYIFILKGLNFRGEIHILQKKRKLVDCAI